MKSTVMDEYLFLHFNREEWDREACFRSWGSSTEVFSWDALCEMELQLPPLPIQQKYVDVYNAMLANQQSYERGLEDLKLVCDAYIEELRREMPSQKIGQFLLESDRRNDLDLPVDSVRGLATSKEMIPTKADMKGVSLASYKMVIPRQIAYVPDTSRRGDKMSLGINNSDEPLLVSSISEVFGTDLEKLLPEYLMLFLTRSEFDRYARFNSWGSARETFNFDDMCDVEIAKIIKKGIAYHIGYLPAAIRMRIEDMFRKGKITTMFCTSTLLEGVNLPADNLFITDNKIFRSRMTPVDFRNLIGRVGRIEYNLYGNVIFVSSQDEKLPETEYVKMLKEPVPEQTLSIDAGPKTLTNPERKYIVEALKEGNIELVKRSKTQSEESYIMMRKFGLILLRDIMTDNNSLVRQSFSDLISKDDAALIKQKFEDPIALPDDDINVSADQTRNTDDAMRGSLNAIETHMMSSW